MIHDPVEILRTFLAATNAQDFARIEAMFAADVVYRSGGVGGRIEGRQKVMAAFKVYFTEYPDQSAQDNAFEQLAPNQARARWSLVATSSRTGAQLIRAGTETITIDVAGLIVKVDVEG